MDRCNALPHKRLRPYLFCRDRGHGGGNSGDGGGGSGGRILVEFGSGGFSNSGTVDVSGGSAGSFADPGGAGVFQSFGPTTATPEPSSVVLLAIGGLALAAAHRRRKAGRAPATP